jgi:capsular polysaccharide transport system permease protein
MSGAILDRIRFSSLRPATRRYLIAVGAPTLLTLIYLSVFAADGYVSRAQVMVEHESTPGLAAAAEMTLGALSLGSTSTKQDALVVQTFMQSRAMLNYLEKELGLRAHYSAGGVDVWGRLSADASEEDFLDYFRKRLTIDVDDATNVIDVEYVAYDAEFAQRVARLIVKRSETFVNEIGQHLAREQMTFVNAEVEKAHQRVQDTSRALILLQRKYDLFSPEKESESTGLILSGLNQELSMQRVELKALQAYLNPKAPEVQVAKARIEALEAQIAGEQRKLVGGDGSGLNDALLAYQDAQVNVTLAGEVYKAALASLETTRLDALRKVKYLVAISEPSAPDDAEHPRIWYWTATIFVFLNLLYFVAGLVIATIEDHRE